MGTAFSCMRLKNVYLRFIRNVKKFFLSVKKEIKDLFVGNQKGMFDLRVWPGVEGSEKTPGKAPDRGKEQMQRLGKLAKKHRNGHMPKVCCFYLTIALFSFSIPKKCMRKHYQLFHTFWYIQQQN